MDIPKKDSRARKSQIEGESKKKLSKEDQTPTNEPPVEVLYTADDHQPLALNNGQMLGEGLKSDLEIDQMDPDEYLKYIQSLLEEQGIDFDEWQQAMVEAAQEEFTANAEAETDEQADAGWWWPTDLDPQEGPATSAWEQEDDNEEAEQIDDKKELENPLEEEKEAYLYENDMDHEYYFEEGDDDDEDVNFQTYLKQQNDPPPKSMMGMKSFRYLESRILANFVRDTEDERMQNIQKRLSTMKRVSRPVPPNLSNSITVLKKSESRSSTSTPSRLTEKFEAQPLKEYTAREWAIKNAESFLRKSGCRSPEQSLTDVEVQDHDKSNKLKVFLEKGALGERRRYGIGSKDAAPEITPALRRQAERAMWRAIIDNSRPKYPLPRFILPRHQFLTKIERELIGPGSYEHDYWEKQRQKKLFSTPSMFRSCSSRFPKEKWNSPASGVIGDPYATWEAACFHKRYPGTVPLFQSTPCNFRYKGGYIGCGLPPTHYDIRSPLDEFLNKNPLSLGIYDIKFDSDTFCNRKLLNDTSSRLGPGAYAIRTSIIKELTSRYNYFKGKISKTDRRKTFGFKAAFEHPLWPVDNGYPGPATYDPYEAEEWFEPSWAPFGILSKARKLDLNIESKLVAADYYYYGDGYTMEKGWKPEIFGGGVKSNFISKTPMISPQHLHIVIQERNKASNHHLAQETTYSKKLRTETTYSKMNPYA